MKALDRRSVFHALFDAGLIAKCIDGLFEVAGGVLLWVMSAEQMNSLVRALTQHELSEDPGDLVAGFLVRATRHVTHETRVFAIVFLVSHGLIKIALVRALVRRELRAYPVAIAVFGGFMVYQLYRYSVGHASWMLVLSVLDLAVILLTWSEYRSLRAAHG
ncbi:MAG: DUF2127 domain-containing protein [Gemmatimonadales bacterium]|jgi:uncharacterized membrane protein